MLYHHTAAFVQRLGNSICQLAHLGKTVFKTDVQVIGVGREECKTPILLQNGQGTDIHAVVIVGQLQTGEHTPDQCAFAGACLADHADELVVGGEIQLGDLLSQGVHTVRATGSVVAAQKMGRSAACHRKTSLKVF